MVANKKHISKLHTNDMKSKQGPTMPQNHSSSLIMAAAIPAEFLPLPDAGPILGGWPANIWEAHNVLQNTFHHGLTLVRQEGGDPIRLNHTSEQLMNDSVRILERMEESGVSPDFTRKCADVIGPLVFELEVASLAAEGVYVSLALQNYMVTDLYIKGERRDRIIGTGIWRTIGETRASNEDSQSRLPEGSHVS
jgi:hypothetical protein